MFKQIVKYIGKTERNLLTRIKEHGNSDVDSATNLHLKSCNFYSEIINQIKLLDYKIDINNKHCLNIILSNTDVLGSNPNWLCNVF